jgi:hypothetical protein
LRFWRLYRFWPWPGLLPLLPGATKQPNLPIPDLCRFSVPGSMITFSTVHDGQGNVLLEQQAAVANPNFFNVFVDQVGGPPTWLKQADNLRRAFR